MDPKSFIVPAIIIVALIFGIASAATGWVTTSAWSYGIIETCSRSGATCFKTSTGCKSRDDARGALAAFTIMGVLFVGFSAVLAVVRLFVAVLNQGVAKMIVFILNLIAVFCFLLSWVDRFQFIRF